MDRRILYAAGAAGVGGFVIWALLKRGRFRKASPDVDPADLLARMFVVELGDKGCLCERNGMAYVALNRSEAWARPLREVLYSAPGRAEWGSGCGGNPDCKYNQRLDEAHTSKAWPKALKQAKLIVSGVTPNNVGKRRTFVHPGYPTYATPSSKRPIKDPETGRYLPVWAISTKYGGKARYEPKDVGDTPTRFS